MAASTSLGGLSPDLQGEADVDRAQQSPQIAVAWQSIGLTLDRQVFIERGDWIGAAISAGAHQDRTR